MEELILIIFIVLFLWLYCDIQEINYSRKRKEYNNMMNFILGFITCWFFMCIFVAISEEFLDNGITLFDGWGTTFLLLPIIPFGVIIKFLFHRKQKKNNEERKDK